jgi:hypothetical protein
VNYNKYIIGSHLQLSIAQAHIMEMDREVPCAQRSFNMGREALICIERLPCVQRSNHLCGEDSKVCREAIMGYSDPSRFTLKLSNAQRSFNNAWKINCVKMLLCEQKVYT